MKQRGNFYRDNISYIVEANYTQGNNGPDDLCSAVDSAVPFPFCHNKDLFVELKPAQNTTLVVICKESCPVEGRSRIEFLVKGTQKK